MEKIKQAVEQAKAGKIGERLHSVIAEHDQSTSAARGEPQSRAQKAEPVAKHHGSVPEITLNWPDLERHRVVAHNVADPRARAFDILRTQVLQVMDQKNWHVLAITSPTTGCGKTLTAINLALSIARQPERSALLVDMDLQRPQIAKSLGLTCDNGLLGVLERRITLSDAILKARIGKHQVTVLACETSTSHSSEWMASREMSSVIEDIRRGYSSHTVILDMPPILASDDVISILPRLDCVLLVAAVGISTVSEIQQCNRHLQSTEVVRVVLNKTADAGAGYYY